MKSSTLSLLVLLPYSATGAARKNDLCDDLGVSCKELNGRVGALKRGGFTVKRSVSGGYWLPLSDRPRVFALCGHVKFEPTKGATS